MTKKGFGFSRRSVLKKGALATGALVIGGTATSGTAAAGIGDGRVGHYHLNNLQGRGREKTKVHDASPANNHGMNHGAKVVKGGGRVGNSFAFDGLNDYVSVNDDASLNVQDELSISFWFKLEGPSRDNNYPRPVSKGQSTTRNGAYSVFVRDTSSPDYIGLRFIDTNNNKHDVKTRGLPNYDDGSWHHVAATYSNSEDVGRLYLDGTQRVERTIQGNVRIRTTDDDLHIGDGNGERHFNGRLDEVRLYDRALSEEEVQDLADMGSD